MTPPFSISSSALSDKNENENAAGEEPNVVTPPATEEVPVAA